MTIFITKCDCMFCRISVTRIIIMFMLYIFHMYLHIKGIYLHINNTYILKELLLIIFLIAYTVHTMYLTQKKDYSIVAILD